MLKRLLSAAAFVAVLPAAVLAVPRDELAEVESVRLRFRDAFDARNGCRVNQKRLETLVAFLGDESTTRGELNGVNFLPPSRFPPFSVSSS